MRDTARERQHDKLDQNLSTITETVELMKVSFVQHPRDGHCITFSIDPQQFPEELLKAPLGTRFMGALVRIDETEQPVPKTTPVEKKKRQQNANVMRAAIVCGEVQFQRFLQRRYSKFWKGALGEGQRQAADALRNILGVESRKDLAFSDEALAAFDKIHAEYELWKKGE